jgi:hypothetical protein
MYLSFRPMKGLFALRMVPLTIVVSEIGRFPLTYY